MSASALAFLKGRMAYEVAAAMIGGLAGALSGAAGSWIVGYYGPRRLEELKAAREEERVWGPRKLLIREMLDRADPVKGRSFQTLKRVTGTPDDDLRRLLVELGARGFTRDDGTEAWIDKDLRPLKDQQTGVP